MGCSIPREALQEAQKGIRMAQTASQYHRPARNAGIQKEHESQKERGKEEREKKSEFMLRREITMTHILV